MAAATCVASVHEPKTPVRGNATGAAMRTFANMPGSITAQRATPKPTLLSVWKMKCGSDIQSCHLAWCDRDWGDFFVWFDCESQDSAPRTVRRKLDQHRVYLCGDGLRIVHDFPARYS